MLTLLQQIYATMPYGCVKKTVAYEDVACTLLKTNIFRGHALSD
jgi:hypothetical protein